MALAMGGWRWQLAVAARFLGERPTTGWRLSLESATLADDALVIDGRETLPRGDSAPEKTFPGDCAQINRDGLPPGELAVQVRATNLDELVVAGQVSVPAVPSAP